MIRASPVAAVIVLASSGAIAAQPGVLAAAAAFKALSEATFAVPDPALDAAAAHALTTMAGVRATFPPGVARDVEAELRALDAARRAHDRAGVALASAEIYRILVVLAGPGGKIPPEVRLLDYARLRYKSDLSARPVRWDNARDAVAFALERWTTLAPRVTTGSLRLRIDKVLEKMNSAAADHDPVRAEQSATELLDLIDQLDAFFAAL